MTVELSLYASLAKYAPDGSKRRGPTFLVIEDGCTIKELLVNVRVPLELVKLLFLNGVHATGDEILKEGDRLGVFPPVAGG